jgi:hypothetical protein
MKPRKHQPNTASRFLFFREPLKTHRVRINPDGSVQRFDFKARQWVKEQRELDWSLRHHSWETAAEKNKSVILEKPAHALFSVGGYHDRQSLTKAALKNRMRRKKQRRMKR